MMRFEFSTASRIVFGTGVLNEIGTLAAQMGKNALVVTGKNTRRAEKLISNLDEAHIRWQIFTVETEPEINTVQRGVDLVRETQVDIVIGFGGGSALDSAKAIAALATNPGDIYEYLEVIGKGKLLQNPSLACIAVPTTAGTGSEVTRNAVLGVPERGVKISIRNDYLLPAVALVDPELTYSLPPEVTARTGLDAFTQLIEPFVSNQANPMTDALCREGIRRVARSLRKAYWHGSDLARQDMCVASLFGGMCLANAKLGAVHGFAGVLGGRYKAPHGAICARLLPEVMWVNVRALKERDPENAALMKYQEIARLVTQDEGASIDDGIKWVQDLCKELGFLGLAEFGVKQGHFSDVISFAQNASSMKGNPIKLNEGELSEILSRAMSSY